MPKRKRPSDRRKVQRVSSRNSVFQHLEVLGRNRTTRSKRKEIVVEGVDPINLCVRNGLLITHVFFSEFDSLSEWAREVTDGQPEAELFSVEAELLAELSGRDAGSEVIVIAKQPEYDIGRIAMDRVVVLDRPSSPGNLGAITRTCNSFGIDAVLISGHGVDPYDPKCITASRGTVFSVPIVRVDSNRELQAILDENRRQGEFVVYGSSAREGASLESVARSRRFALIIGNEKTGMARHLREASDLMVRIPVEGDASSLNAACAASILIYELSHRQLAG